MTLHMATLNPTTWDEYTSWFAHRGVAAPMPTDNGIFVQDARGRLVGGALCYPTKGPFLLIEHLSTHPGLGPKELLAVVQYMAKAALGVGAACSKYPVILAIPTLSAALERAGYQATETKAFLGFPGQLPAKKETPREPEEAIEGLSDEADGVGGLSEPPPDTSTIRQSSVGGKKKSRRLPAKKKAKKRASARASRGSK